MRAEKVEKKNKTKNGFTETNQKNPQNPFDF